jgi:hypothetical protein
MGIAVFRFNFFLFAAAVEIQSEGAGCSITAAQERRARKSRTPHGLRDAEPGWREVCRDAGVRSRVRAAWLACKCRTASDSARELGVEGSQSTPCDGHVRGRRLVVIHDDLCHVDSLDLRRHLQRAHLCVSRLRWSGLQVVGYTGTLVPRRCGRGCVGDVIVKVPVFLPRQLIIRNAIADRQGK